MELFAAGSNRRFFVVLDSLSFLFHIWQRWLMPMALAHLLYIEYTAEEEANGAMKKRFLNGNSRFLCECIWI